MQEKWLDWAIRLQAIAQSGLTYSDNKYDLQRFQEIRDVSAEILREYSDVSMDKVVDLFCFEKGYQTPKIDVRAVIIEDGRILLVKEQIDGKWSLPGGWAEVDLTLSENVVKEVKEEAGMDVEAFRLLAVLDARKGNPYPSPFGIYKILIACKKLGGSFVPNIETSECGSFSLDDLPELSTGRTSKDQIALSFLASRNENMHTIFD